MLPNVREVAHGKWPGILSALGIDDKFLKDKHGPCPLCGGKDRYRFDDKQGSGSFYCSSCGAGDGVRLVMAFKNIDFKNAASQIEQAAGFVKSQKYDEKKTDDQKRKALNAVWADSVPVTSGDPVCGYLESRGIVLSYIPPSLRYSPSLKYYREDQTLAGHYQGMLAMVTAPDGSGATIHRTYLHEGKKADVPSPKKLMQGLPIKGAAIRLAPIAETIGVAEGIETALAAMQQTGVPTWACVSANGIETFQPPEGVKRVVIFGDNDSNFVGQSAAYKLACSLVRAGLNAEVRIYEEAGKDWADGLRTR